MAERYSFFNAEVDTSGNYDRTYLAEDIASYFASFVGNGVYANSADNLKIVPSDAMTIAVKAGKGWINGYYYENDSDLEFLLDNADGAKGRIDSVVLRLDLTNRYLRIFVKKGALATNPVAPTLTRNADVYELQLATISVPAGATAIAEAQITDTRFNSAICGVVAGVIEQIDATNLFSQYDDAFNTWFEGAKGILNSDTATQLSNRIDTVDGEIQKIVDGTTQTTPIAHTHDDRYYTETEMDTKLNGKEPAFAKNNAFNKNFGTAAGTVCQGNDSRLSNARRASNITMALASGNLWISYS
mgnify:CR=1 FL=1|nr:MAG TPA: Receptor Binding Protein [Caudoviricetes sp.]